LRGIMTTKQKLKLITEKGVAVYPRLDKPDTKFNKRGVFSTGLRLDISDPKVQEWMQTIEEVVTAEAAAAKRTAKKGVTIETRLPFKTEQDEDGVDTGFIVARFKLNASYDKDGETVEMTPTIIDSRKGPYRGPQIGAGSELRIKHTVAEYTRTTDDGNLEAGVTLYMNVVQVIKLVAFVGNLTGFDEEEGYSSESFETEETTDAGPDADFK